MISAHLVGGADGDGALGGDDLVARSRFLPMVLGDREDGGEVGGAVGGGRRADGDEDDLGAADRAGDVGGEREAAGLGVLGDQRVEPGLVDGDLAALEARDLARVDVDAVHVVAEVGEPRARDEADVARTHDSKLHGGRYWHASRAAGTGRGAGAGRP